MGTKYLTESISYTDDIKPHVLTMLYAGVGSGKNHFINQLIAGYEDTLHDGTKVKLDPLYVLVITSRRSKVNELLTEEDLPIDDKIGKWTWDRQIFDPTFPSVEHTGKHIRLEGPLGVRDFFQRSVACTNAFIERYMQYVYHPQDITSHLWEVFDLIVIDEAHSLVTDASYQTAPFHVNQLISEFVERHEAAKEDPEHHKAPRCGNMLLMTGSKAPMKKFTFPGKPHVIDLMEECINVIPQNIHFITSADAKAQLIKQLKNGEKAVYFSNHTPKIEEFLEGTSVDPATVAVSFSKQEGRDKLAKDDPAAYERMVRVETSVAEDNRVPSDIHLWLTTSRNKEGINILNNDIDHLYVESHIQSDIIQMAGRIRSGVQNMYVVIDSQDNHSPEWPNLAYFCNRHLATSTSSSGSIFDACNECLEDLCIRHGIEGMFNMKDAERTAYGRDTTCRVITDCIDYFHETFPYVRYSYLDNVFRFYQLRKISRQLQATELRLFKNAVTESEQLEALFRMWFPDSIVHPYVPSEEVRRQEAIAYLNEQGVLDVRNRFDQAACTAIRNELNRIYSTNLTSLNPLLKRCAPFKMKRVSNNPSNPAYNLYRAVPLDPAC